MVYGYGASESGLLLIPMVAGVMATAISSGQMLSKTGEHQIFPIVRCFLVVAAALSMSTLEVATSVAVVCLYVYWDRTAAADAGVGGTERIPVANVADVGNATSANTFFREIGAAVVGTTVTNRLTDSLPAGNAG